MAAGPGGSDAELREELTQLVTALWYDIDHHQGTAASTYFTDDGELRFENATFRGPAEINDVYIQRASKGPRVSRHVVTNLHVTAADEAGTRATSTLILYAQDGTAPRPDTTPALVADVHDVFERQEERWLIRSRHIVQLFIAPSTVLAVPTGAHPRPTPNRESR